MKVFITFGGPTSNYHNAVQRICNEARSLDVFDQVRGFTEKDLVVDTEFWKKHGEFISNNRRGYGYWIWKSHLIKKTVDSLNEGDIVVYCDAGCHLNKKGIVRLNEYFEMLRTNPEEYGVLSFQMNHLKEYRFTKRAVFEHFQSSPEIQESGQCIGTVQIIMKNKHSDKILNLWVDNSKYELINDSIHDERHELLHARHDQSILSVIVKTYGSIKLPDETFFPPNVNNWSDWTDGDRFPIHTRRWV
jgi:hypothetical protein